MFNRDSLIWFGFMKWSPHNWVASISASHGKTGTWLHCILQKNIWEEFEIARLCTSVSLGSPSCLMLWEVIFGKSCNEKHEKHCTTSKSGCSARTTSAASCAQACIRDRHRLFTSSGTCPGPPSDRTMPFTWKCVTVERNFNVVEVYPGAVQTNWWLILFVPHVDDGASHPGPPR